LCLDAVVAILSLINRGFRFSPTPKAGSGLPATSLSEVGLKYHYNFVPEKSRRTILIFFSGARTIYNPACSIFQSGLIGDRRLTHQKIPQAVLKICVFVHKFIAD
jgi:hypothetical protein